MAKICDTTYFGIQKQSSFQQVSNDLTKMLKNHFWQFQDLDR